MRAYLAHLHIFEEMQRRAVDAINAGDMEAYQHWHAQAVRAYQDACHAAVVEAEAMTQEGYEDEC